MSFDTSRPCLSLSLLSNVVETAATGNLFERHWIDRKDKKRLGPLGKKVTCRIRDVVGLDQAEKH
jgi:hypothetical protein